MRSPTVIPAEALEVHPESSFKPVQTWAWAGGLLLLIQHHVWGKWITGPYFVEVPSGPSCPPVWMQTVLVAWTGVIHLGFPVAIYCFIIKPRRRERHITTDGMLLGAFAPLFFPDPLLDHLNAGCTCNAGCGTGARGCRTSRVGCPGVSRAR
jgi:hypothetical protein